MHLPAPFLFSLILACAPLAAQEKVTLRYQFEPGKTCWLQQTTDVDMRMGEMKFTMAMSMWMEGKVTEVKNGVATIEQRYVRMKMKNDSPMMKVDYDSDVEGSKAGPLRNAVDLIGKSAKAKVDAMGKVLEFTVPDGLAEELEKFGFNMKQAFEQQFMALPKDPVAVGETWKSSTETSMAANGTMKTETTSKLVAVKDQVVTVEQTMAMDTSGMTGMKVEVTKAGGSGKYALTSLVPLESAMTAEMKVEGAGAQGMTMTNRSSLKAIEAPAPKKPDAAKKPADAGKTGEGK